MKNNYGSDPEFLLTKKFSENIYLSSTEVQLLMTNKFLNNI